MDQFSQRPQGPIFFSQYPGFMKDLLDKRHWDGGKQVKKTRPSPLKVGEGARAFPGEGGGGVKRKRETATSDGNSEKEGEGKIGVLHLKGMGKKIHRKVKVVVGPIGPLMKRGRRGN